MKKLLLFAFSLLLTGVVLGQWTPITIEGPSSEAVSITSYLDTIMVGFATDGIYRSDDLGDTWQDINGNLSNKNINKVQAGPWPSIFVSTDDGAFFTIEQETYTPASTSGLDNTDISLYFVGGDTDGNKFVIGTNGGGFYYGPELEGPWTAANNGLSGDALTINAVSGYSGESGSNYILGTNNGVYYSNDEFASWTPGNNGLSGAQLEVTGVMLLNTYSIISTHGGVFTSPDYGQTWTSAIPDEKFNVLLLSISQEGSFMLFFLGETAYLTSDLVTLIPIDTPGEIISAAVTSTELFITTTATENKKDRAAGMFRQPIDWIITALPENPMETKRAQLEQNYPNPFSSSTTISYELVNQQKVDIRVYDMLGREVAVLENGVQNSGKHEVAFDAPHLFRGVYSVVLKLEDGTVSNIRMIKN